MSALQVVLPVPGPPDLRDGIPAAFQDVAAVEVFGVADHLPLGLEIAPERKDATAVPALVELRARPDCDRRGAVVVDHPDRLLVDADEGQSMAGALEVAAGPFLDRVVKNLRVAVALVLSLVGNAGVFQGGNHVMDS